MSTKSTIFLTDDNIHWYEDCSEPNFDANDKFIGDSIILEFDTSFAKISQYGSEIFITLKPGCDLYNKIKQLKQ